MKKSENILISVITVCFNEAERIQSTIESIAFQTYRNFELVVIDGGSTDGTLEILENNKNKIDHLISEPDDGIYSAMNKGLAIAKGDYIQFMNGGDRYFDENVLMNLISGSTYEDIIFGNYCNIYPSGTTTTIVPTSKPGYLFFTFNSICHQSFVCKKELLMDHGGFDTRFKIAADYLFLVQCILQRGCSTFYIPVMVAFFYRDGISAISESKDLLRSERLAIQKKHFPKFYYVLSKTRYWFVDNRNQFVIKKIRKLGNLAFKHILKSKER